VGAPALLTGARRPSVARPSRARLTPPSKVARPSRARLTPPSKVARPSRAHLTPPMRSRRGWARGKAQTGVPTPPAGWGARFVAGV
jgi:hypothetical protein